MNVAPACRQTPRRASDGTVSTHDSGVALARALEAVNVRGGLVDARRVTAVADTFGSAAVPFLWDCVSRGSPAVAAAALLAVARAAPERVTPLALAVMRDSSQDSEVRAAAAEALTASQAGGVLDVLLDATTDSPTVSAGALRALRQRRSAVDTAGLLGHLRALVAELSRTPVESPRLRRLTRALFGPDGRSGLLRLVTERAMPEAEGDLVSWWRSHPTPALKAAVAYELVETSVVHADSVLMEGLPGCNDGHPREPLGELDNGPVRHALAHAACAVLSRTSASAAFERLSPYVAGDTSAEWFTRMRAEIILLLLLGQVGVNPTSWLHGYAEGLRRRGVAPDTRWRTLLTAVQLPSPLHRELANELRARLPQ